MRVAIIGAGMAGLACATRLREGGLDVSLFDKGRGPGGRMSTRRIEAGVETLHFDHGAQYFTARDPAFLAQVQSWESDGVAARWPQGGSDAWVGTPGMNAPIRAMADALGTQFGKRVDAVSREEDGWKLSGEDLPSDRFEALVVALPAEQAGPLLAGHDKATSALAMQTQSDPCWTVMLAFEEPLPFAHDTIRNAGPIGWAARNSSKPGRGETECWVVQANPEWSRDHLEEEREAIEPMLRDALAAAIGHELPPVLASSAHRWRFAKSGAAGNGYVWNGDTHLGMCGDWLLAPRVEAAFLSGRALAEAMLSDRA